MKSKRIKRKRSLNFSPMKCGFCSHFVCRVLKWTLVCFCFYFFYFSGLFGGERILSVAGVLKRKETKRTGPKWISGTDRQVDQKLVEANAGAAARGGWEAGRLEPLEENRPRSRGKVAEWSRRYREPGNLAGISIKPFICTGFHMEAKMVRDMQLKYVRQKRAEQLRVCTPRDRTESRQTLH